MTPDQLERFATADAEFLVHREDVGSLARALRVGKPYELGLVRLFKDRVRKDMTVFDIGANIGYFTVLFSKLARKVYAFEPDARNYRILDENLRRNGCTNVTPLQIALSDKRERCLLFTDQSYHGTHSLAKENLPVHSGSALVDTRPLDEFGPAEVIKIDAQGAEAKILEGARAALTKAGLLTVEFWPYGLERVGSDPAQLLDLLYATGGAVCQISKKGELLRFQKAELTEFLDRKQLGKWSSVNLAMVREQPSPG